jgi:hypothetical protein
LINLIREALKHYYYYDTIHQIEARMTLPKKPGHGIVGVFMPKLDGHQNFSLYGENLSPADQEKAVELFHTIRLMNKSE